MAEFDVNEITALYNNARDGVDESDSMPKVYDPGYYTPMQSMAERQQEQADKEWKAAKAFYNGFAVEGGRGLLNATLMMRELGIQRAKEDEDLKLLNSLGVKTEYEETQGTGEALNAALESSAMQKYEVKGDTAAGQFGLDLASGAGQLASQMAVTYLTGGWGGAAYMAATTSGNQYEELRKSGVSAERASQASVMNGIVQGVMEKMGLDQIMKVLPANSPLKKKIAEYAVTAFSEGGTEALQSLPEQLTNLWAKNEGASLQDIGRMWDENAAENLKEMAYSGALGAILGVGGRAANSAVNTVVEGIGQKVHEHQVNALEKRIEAAKYNGKTPEQITFETNEALPEDYVFVDADMLQTYMQTKNAAEVAETLGVSEEEIAAAVELGNDITVRQGNYEGAAAKFGDLHNALKEGISFGGADESANNVQRREELRKEYQDLDAETKNQLNSEIDKIMQSAETAGINQNVREGLRSILLSRAMIWDADHPANFFKEHPITFSNQGMVDNGKGAYFQEKLPLEGEAWKKNKELIEAKLEKDSAIFGEMVDEWEKDPETWFNNHKGKLLDLGSQTPLAMTLVGMKQLPLKVSAGFFGHSAKGAHPGMTPKVIKQIPKALAEPIMILKNYEKVNGSMKEFPNKRIFVLGIKNEFGATVIVPVQISVNSGEEFGEVNLAKTSFGVGDKRPKYQFFKDALDIKDKNKQLLYLDNKKALAWARTINANNRDIATLVRKRANDKSILHKEALVNAQKNNPGYYQKSSGEAKGAIQFSQDGAAVINLFKGADATTVIHETGHYFVEAMARDIENGIANEQQIKDFEALLKYSDLDMDRWNSIREQLKNGNLTEADREALQSELTKVHERLAEAFESYIIEGKAPKRELRHVFSRFAKWMRAVYSSIRQNAQGEEVKEYDPANRNPNAGALTKEVTDVFDRWLAAEEDIAAQETIDGFFAQIPESVRNFLSEKSQAQIKDYIAKAHDEAIRILTQTYMKNFGKERAAKIAAYKKNVRAEAEETVRNRPLYTAMAALSEYLESGKQAPKTLARKYLRSINNEALSRKEALENIKADINERLEPIVEQLEAGIGEERTYWVDKETGKETDVSDLGKNKSEELKTRRYYEQVTEDTSADWYKNYKEQYGKRNPSKKRLREIAYEIYTGNDEFGLYAADLFGMSAEDAETYNAEIANNKAEIDALLEQQKYLESVAEIRAPWGWDKADTRFTMAEGDRILFDGIAEELGFHTGEELAKAIRDGDTFRQAVRKEVDAMANKVFPDYFTDAQLRQDAIREALYNDQTGQVIALEQQLIEDYVAGVGARQRSNEAKAKLARARKQTIKNIALRKISVMTMRQLQNVRGFIRAERMAAAEAQRAIKNGDMEAAAMWKETQAVNHAIVVEAVRIKNETKEAVKTIARIRRMKKELFGTEQHFNQVAAMLARMGERVSRKDYEPATKTQSLAEYVQEMSELYDNVDVADWLLDESIDLSNAKELTYEEYTDVINSLKNLVKVSQNERKRSKLDAERTMQETKADVISELNRLEDRYEPGPNGKDDRNSAKYFLDKALASLRNTDNLFELMDNWTYGYFSKTWGAALKRCADFEAELTMQMEEDYRNAYAEWIKENPGIEGNDRDVYYDELGTVANKKTLIKMLINLGNNGNSRMLCSTPPIDMKESKLWVRADDGSINNETIAQTKANLIEFLGKYLTASDVKFAQRQVDIASRNWPLLADVERRAKGFTPKKVEASPVCLTFADGTSEVFKGGYYPLVRDTRLGSRPQNVNVFDIDGDIPAANLGTMHTNTGAGKARTQAVYPISLAADSGMRSIRDVIHDIAYREVMADFRKLLNDKEVMPLLKQKLGIATTEQLGEMLIKTANPSGTRLVMAEDFYASAANWIRRKTVNAAIMLNVKTALQNLGNITLYGRAVEGFGYADTYRAVIGRGILQAADFRGNTELDNICSKSVFMRERVLAPDYTIKEIMGEENLSPVQRKTMRWGAMVLAYTDNLTAKPVWAEAYRKKIAEGATEQEAIDFADTIIRRVLGSNRTQDVSSFMRGGPIYKLFTSFQGFFNTQFNQWEREAGIAKNLYTKGEYATMAERITAFAMSKWLLNCMLALYLGMEDPFERDDKDGYMNLTKEMMHYPFSLCGPIGQATNMFMDNLFGISSYRFRLSAIESTLDKGGKLMRATQKVYQGKDDISSLAEPASGIILPLVFDVPDQVNKLLWNAYDILYNGMSPEVSDLVRRRPKNERK